jgi:exopolyphosphatase/guanosine-5'-triphosphate,3'-diphosphate pyrophosphatase
MTGKDLAKKLLSIFPDLEKEVALSLTNAFFETLKSAMKDGHSVELRGFGTFQPRVCKGVIFVNPKNNQRYYVQEKKRVVFRTGSEFLERLNTPLMLGLTLGPRPLGLFLESISRILHTFSYGRGQMLDLGRGFAKAGLFVRQQRKEAFLLLKNFKEILDRYEVKNIKAIGTAVFRKAKNAMEFIGEVEKNFGIKIEVLSPKEEAKYTLKGIKFGLERLDYKPKSFVVVDVGGGSTEVIYYKEDFEPIIYSLDLGVVTLRDFFGLRYPLTAKALQSLRDYIRDKLKELPYTKPEMLVITGGSASLLGSLDLKLKNYDQRALHGHRITLDRIAKMAQRLTSMTLSQLSRVRGMERGREDLVAPALCVYLELLSYFQLDSALISEFGILEATLLSLWGL